MCSFKAGAQTLPVETITRILLNVNSIKVQFMDPPGVTGIVDHRAYVDGDSTTVKYAGQTVVPNPVDGAGQNGIPQYIDVPTMEIELNGITRHTTHTVVVEAVDCLGPFPIGNVTSTTTNLLVSNDDPMSIGNSNEGMTLDGDNSTNGQGTTTAVPNVLACSVPVTFKLNVPQPLPSVPGVSPNEMILEGFATPSTITKVSADGNGDDLFTVAIAHANNTTVLYDWIQYQTDDTATQAFIMRDHWMDCVFDGAPYYEFGGSVMHNNHGLAALSPHKAVAINTETITHFTFEADAHCSGRRYISLVLAPSNDAPVNWYNGAGPFVGFNKSNHAIEFRIDVSTIDATLFNGYASDGVTPDNLSITGPCASGIQYAVYRSGQGRGIDDRSRFDFYVSQTHWRVYEDGVQVYDGGYGIDPLTGKPATLGFNQARMYLAHWMYHSSLGHSELQTYYPWEQYWINDAPYGDERHENNIGFEALPVTVTWSNIDTTSMAGVANNWAEASSYTN